MAGVQLREVISERMDGECWDAVERLATQLAGDGTGDPGARRSGRFSIHKRETKRLRFNS